MGCDETKAWSDVILDDLEILMQKKVLGQWKLVLSEIKQDSCC